MLQLIVIIGIVIVLGVIQFKLEMARANRLIELIREERLAQEQEQEQDNK